MRTLATWSLLICCLTLALAAGPALADDKPAAPPPMKKIDNPEYLQWSPFKVGAFVEMTSESTAMGVTSGMKMTTKLLELTADKAVLETVMVSMAGGQEFALPASKRDVSRVLEVPDIKLPEGKTDAKVSTKDGEETIEVAGKKLACKTVESTFEMSGTKTWSKSWMTKDIPGGTAKTESKSDMKVGEMAVSSTTRSTVTKFGTGA